MAEVKATKVRDGLLLSGAIPQELLSSTTLGIIPLRDGSFLLTPKQEQPKVSNLLNEREKVVVKKLLSVRFEKRTPQEIARILSHDEKETLDSLMKKNIVHLFRGERYSKEGVYSISDFAFHQARGDEKGASATAAKGSTKPPTAMNIAPLSLVPPPISSPEHLDKFGWMILESESDARSFSNSFPDKVRSGAVKGIRAFDRKYYFVSQGFVLTWEKKITAALDKKEKTAEEISSELALNADGCRCLLYHMCESGDVLEKHRGKFARA